MNKIPDISVLKKLKSEELIRLLEMLVAKLDEQDEDVFFGTEGWRHYLGFGD